MNQAALHALLASRANTEGLKKLFDLRLATNATLIKELYFSLYPKDEVAFEKLLDVLKSLFEKRPEKLQTQDLERLKKGNWYQSEEIVGMQLYVDHFNKDLKGLKNKLSYFDELGVNFLHLMPITTRPKGENDGGYAVNSYHEIDKRYGTKKDLLDLTKTLRSKNMYLMLDFVVNHTSNEYPWAKKAMAGDKKYQDFYYTYADRTIPDAFEKTLPEIFPKTSPGNFTYNEKMQKWVMTAFNSYQWDLNYTNPEVFLAMLTNLSKLVNLGVDVVRFDALAFLWKKIGTISQNLPEAHTLVSLFKVCLQTFAPGVILLAEAIVAPREIIKYFGEGMTRGNECELAYNASLMALLWNSIATKKTGLLYKSIINIPDKPDSCGWINYIRCHDDIGLGIDDGFISEMGWNPTGHRRFLLDYYCQGLPWSPAKGLLFMFNPKTGDGRITGSTASLLGLEKALDTKDTALLDEAVEKIVLLHGIVLAYGGLPLIYAGDEIGTLNDYSFLKDNTKKEDSRWVNRPHQNWEIIAGLDDATTPNSKIFHRLKKLISIRKKNKVFADNSNVRLHHSGNDHILLFERTDKKSGVLVIANFNTATEVVDASAIQKMGYIKNSAFEDMIQNKKIKVSSGFLEIAPYQLLWLKKS
ncbi:MAG: alpha amylase [Allomuricauda sp.]|nr:MAG: alpha amylase [Allomuricauda sp.]